MNWEIIQNLILIKATRAENKNIFLGENVYIYIYAKKWWYTKKSDFCIHNLNFVNNRINSFYLLFVINLD